MDTYIFLRRTVLELVWDHSHMRLPFQVLLELGPVDQLAADFVVGRVSSECVCPLRLLTVLVHQNLLLMIKAHANVSVIMFLILGYLLQEVLEVNF